MTFSLANVAPKIRKGAAKHFGGWGRMGMLVLLLSVFFQSYVAQTHVHRSGQSFVQVVSDLVASSVDAPQNPLAPTDDDNANCLLCQAVLQSGAVSVPALMAVLLPVMVLLGLIQASYRPVARAIVASHRWQSRAPPRS